MTKISGKVEKVDSLKGTKNKVRFKDTSFCTHSFHYVQSLILTFTCFQSIKNKCVRTKMRLKDGTKIENCRGRFASFDSRLFVADFWQVICRLLAGYWLISSHATVSNSYLCFLSQFHPISA